MRRGASGWPWRTSAVKVIVRSLVRESKSGLAVAIPEVDGIDFGLWVCGLVHSSTARYVGITMGAMVIMSFVMQSSYSWIRLSRVLK